jgi:hypothetical protein
MKNALRLAAGIVALVAAWYAIVIGIDLADVLTRPINQGWLEVLLILFLPLFIGVATLTAVATMLGRYAWRGRFF